MYFMNEFVRMAPFDLFEIHLLHLLAEHESFTRVGQIVGLTQSAISRQIQKIETRLGVPLLERTTRKVKTTSAGDFVLRETNHIVGDIETLLRRLREDYADAPKEIRVGVSRTISLAYLPGFFFANQHRHPEVTIKATHQPSQSILNSLEAGDLDVAVICPPKIISGLLVVTHRFEDAFTLIAPKTILTPKARFTKTSLPWQQWLSAQTWFLIDDQSNTGRRLRRWMTNQGWKIKVSTQIDNFDLIINLVALGMGVSLVPHRALALYGRKRSIRRYTLPNRFKRNLIVLIRKSSSCASHVTQFVENILF